jgi:hypothetical protein
MGSIIEDSYKVAINSFPLFVLDQIKSLKKLFLKKLVYYLFFFKSKIFAI